jgi:hypothetical protein
MAGSPTKRKRREAAARATEAPPLITPAPMREALPTTDEPAIAVAAEHTHARARAPNAPAHAPARATAPGRRPAIAPGPAVRAAADASVAAQLGAATRALRGAVIVRIERLRPHWCSGWLEDYALDDGDVGELLPYLRDEWGGESYRLTVLGPDNVAISDHKQPIAGPPRDRGRVINRDVWEGRAPVATAQPVAAPQPAAVTSPDQSLINTAFNMMRDANRAQFDAVKEMRASDSKQMAELIQSINRRTENDGRPKGPSFVEQVNEIVASTQALNDMREAIAIEPPPRAEGDESDGMLTKEAMRQFMARAFGGPQLVPHPTQSSEGRAQQRRPDLREAKTEAVPPRPGPRPAKGSA